jgi:hypothetical protein
VDLVETTSTSSAPGRLSLRTPTSGPVGFHGIMLRRLRPTLKYNIYMFRIHVSNDGTIAPLMKLLRSAMNRSACTMLIR